jgi:lipid A 4'-phosphatase
MRLLLFVAAMLVGALVFWAFPGIDLWASGLFWRPGAGFYLRDFPPFAIAHQGLPYLTAAIVLALAGMAFWTWRRERSCRLALYLALSLAVGPGLVVNTTLKDNWGRARPSQVAAFGGAKAFTPAPVMADQCERNCSFVAGDPAIGFWFLSLAFLLPPPRRYLAEACALALGAFLGLARIAQGGHFLSDVVFCGFAVAATAWLLHWLIVRKGALRMPGRSRGIL